MKGKTIVMVTNNQQFLPKMDRIIVLQNGEIVEDGNYKALIENNGYFKNEYMIELTNQEEHHDETE